VPEVVTLSYRWDAFDRESGARRPLVQAIGGFWVGCSLEGLMALGTVRFFEHGRVEAVINGARYQIDLYRSEDGQSLRTTSPPVPGSRLKRTRRAAGNGSSSPGGLVIPTDR
jgi:hypothetical protein